MKTAFGIFWHDLKQVLRNPFALVVVVGLIVLPSVYAWYSVAAMWNPYSHTDGLKVAVVNEDAGATYDGKELHVGDMLVEGIGQDHSFDWQFVDAERGRSGLESGEYYAEFILPESFTGDFLSVLNGDLKNPTIEYWVNEKYNAVALEVTDAGAGVVDAIINRVFSALAADALSDVVKNVAEEVLDTSKSTDSQAQSGLEGAVRDLQNVENGLNGASSSLDKWGDSVSSAKRTLDSLKKTAPDLRSAIEDGEKLLADVRTAAHKVSSTYSSALAEGGPELSSLLNDLAKRVEKVTDEISSKQADITDAEGRAASALRECEEIVEDLLKLDPDSKKLAELEAQNKKLLDELSKLEAANASLEEAAEEANEATSKLASDVEKATKNMKDRNDAFNSEILPALDTGLDSVALVMGSLDGALGNLEKQVDQAKTLLDEVDEVLQRTRDALGQTSEALGEVGDRLDAAQSDLKSLAGSEVMKKLSDVVDIDVKSYGSFMASPVKAQMNPVYPLNSYGAGVAPFYTCLAIWVGCFMLIAVIKLEADPELFPRMKPWQGYVGRLALFAVLAALQGVIVTVGDLVLGVQAASPVAFVVAGLFAAFCFANIVYALAITFKHVGKALAVIFLIVQIPGASGMYPIQLMPDFFQALYPWLPFTYGMGAMREAIGGFYGATYAHCLLWLLACGLVTLALALIVRPRVLNLNRLFDRKLANADLYITEEHGLGTDVGEHPVLEALLETEEGRAQVVARANAFSRRYSVVRQIAPLAVVVLVICLGLVSGLLNLSVDGKLVALALFIFAVVLIFCACVAYEYVNDNLIAATAGMPITDVFPDARPRNAPGVIPAIPSEEDEEGAFEGEGAEWEDVEWNDGAEGESGDEADGAPGASDADDADDAGSGRDDGDDADE